MVNRESMPQSSDAPGRMEGMVPGVKAGGFLFLSAIRGRDPKTNTMPDDPLQQARQALRNIEAVLAGSGATLTHVVKVTLYLHDLEKRHQFHHRTEPGGIKPDLRANRGNGRQI